MVATNRFVEKMVVKISSFEIFFISVSLLLVNCFVFVFLCFLRFQFTRGLFNKVQEMKNASIYMRFDEVRNNPLTHGCFVSLFSRVVEPCMSFFELE